MKNAVILNNSALTISYNSMYS